MDTPSDIQLLVITADQDRRLADRLIDEILPRRQASALHLLTSVNAVPAGEDRCAYLHTQLAHAAGAVLLLSPDFLNDEVTCMPLALAALHQWSAQAPPILPLLLRPCAWQAESRLARLWALFHEQTALMGHARSRLAWEQTIEYVQDWIAAYFPRAAPLFGVSEDEEARYRLRLAEDLKQRPYFVEPRVQSAVQDAAAPKKSASGAIFDIPPVAITSPANLVRNLPAVAFLGGSASGKTTLLCAMGHRAAEYGIIGSSVEAKEPGWRARACAYLPIMARVRDLVPRLIEQPVTHWGLLNQLAQHAANSQLANKKELERCLRRALLAGRLMVLLDSLEDASNPEQQASFQRILASFIECCPAGNRIVLTSKADIKFSVELAGLVQQATLLSLSTSQIEKFLTRAEQSCDSADSEPLRYREARKRQLLLAMANDAGLRTLIETPLMLKMWAEFRGSSQPKATRGNDRITLIEQYVEQQLREYGMNLSGTADGAARHEYTARRVLERLALYFLEMEPQTAVSQPTLHRELVAILGQSPAEKRPQRGIEREVGVVLRNISRLRRLLTESRNGLLTFEQEAFRSYFAARGLARMSHEERWQRIESRLRDGCWRDPIIYCIGLLGLARTTRADADMLISEIIRVACARAEEIPPELFLALAAVLESQQVTSRALPTLVAQLRHLASGQLPAVRRQALDGLSNLARLGVADARAIVDEWLARPSPDVELIWAQRQRIDADPHGPVRQRLCELLYHAAPAIRASAILALEPAAQDDSELSKQLIPALDSPDDDVLRAGFRVLMPLFGRHNDLQPELRARLGADNSRAVIAGLTALGEDQLTDPEIRRIFYQRLRDQPPLIRCQLLAELIPRALSDQDDRATLVAALDDPHFSVRRSVLGSLCYLSRFDSGIRDAVLAHIDAGWPGQHPDTSAQVLEVYLLFTRFMNLREPPVWNRLRPKLQHPDREVRRGMINALAPWVEHIGELQADLWRMVENDEEDTEVRQSALAALLPVAGRYPEKRLLLERRMNPVPDSQSAPIIPMVWALGELARIDAPTRTWLKRQLKTASNPLLRAVFLSVLHRARPRDRSVTSGLLSMLVQQDFSATHIAFQALSPSLKSASLARREVQEVLAHDNVWMRREAVRWLLQLQPADSRVRSALKRRLLDDDSMVFPLVFINLLISEPSKLEDAELFASYAQALLRFNQAQSEPASRLPTDLLALGIYRHTDPQAALSCLQSQDPKLAEQLAHTVNRLRELIANPQAAMALIANRIEGTPGVPPTILFLSAVVWGHMAKQHGKNPMEHFGRHLNSPNPRLHMIGMGALAAAEPQPGYPFLTNQLADPTASVDARVLSTFMLIGEGCESVETVNLLMKQLHAPDERLRFAALKILMERAVTDKEIARELVPWLGVYTEGAADSRATLPLLDLLPFNGPMLRFELATVLARHLTQDNLMRQRVIDHLDAPAWPQRQAAAWALSLIPGGPPEELRARIRKLGNDPRCNENLLERLQAARAFLAASGNSAANLEKIWELLTEGLSFGLAPWQLVPLQGQACRQAALLLLASLPPSPIQRSLLKERATQDPADSIRELAHQLSVSYASAVTAPADEVSEVARVEVPNRKEPGITSLGDGG